jgi:hypothetical protein
LFGLRAAPRALVVPVAEALGDEPRDPRGLGTGQKMVGALGAQPVRRRELGVESLKVFRAAQPAHLVDHHLGLGPQHRLLDGVVAQTVDDDWLGADAAQPADPVCRPGRRHHLVTALDQQRHQSLADHTGPTSNEHLHCCPPPRLFPTTRPCLTQRSGRRGSVGRPLAEAPPKARSSPGGRRLARPPRTQTSDGNPTTKQRSSPAKTVSAPGTHRGGCQTEYLRGAVRGTNTARSADFAPGRSGCRSGCARAALSGQSSSLCEPSA